MTAPSLSTMTWSATAAASSVWWVASSSAAPASFSLRSRPASQRRAAGIQPLLGLVEHHQPPRPDQHRGQLQGLELAAGQRPGQRAAVIVQTALRQRPVHQVGGRPARAVRHRDQLQVLPDGEVRVGADQVADHRDLGARPPGRPRSAPGRRSPPGRCLACPGRRRCAAGWTCPTRSRRARPRTARRPRTDRAGSARRGRRSSG